MTNPITPWSSWSNPFQEIVDIGNTRLSTYCKRFENGGFEKLVQLWMDYYLDKYNSEIKNPETFKSDLIQCIQWYWDYLSKRISGDKSELYDKAWWIESKYKELLSDENHEWPKKAEEAISEKPNLSVRLAKKVQKLVSGLVPKM